MKHPLTTALLDHWLSIRYGRRVPDRNDLDPVAIRGMLAYTFMLDVDDVRPSGRTYPVRVSGTRLDALFGRSVKGAPFLELWQAGNREELRAVTESVLDDGTPAVVGGAGAPPGYEPVTVEMLMLPLRCRGRTHARLLCSLTPFTTPRWIGLDGVAPIGLSTWRLLNNLPPSAPSRVVETTHDAGAMPAGALRRFTVIEGGRSVRPVPVAASAQARVKIAVTGSPYVPRSTHTS